MKTILFISAGAEAASGIRLAKSMGFHVVATDGNPNAPSFSLCDDRIVADTYNAEETVAKAFEYNRGVRPIDGVISVAADVPLTTASVAKELGLFGIPLDAARLSMDKLAMKRRLIEYGVAVPIFSEVRSVLELKSFARKHGFPLVIKPTDSRGARGVLKLSANSDLGWSYHFSLSQSPTQRVIVEKFLDGPQISTESMILGGKEYTPGFSDRNYELMETYSPHIIENGGDMPSIHSETTRTAVCKLIEDAAASHGVRNGIIKGDVVLHDGRPFLIELATRLSGGYFCTHQIPFSTGVDLVRCAISQAIGERLDPDNLIPKYSRHVCKRYWFPKSGQITRISGIEGLHGNDAVLYHEIRCSVGDVVKPIQSHPGRAGVVITTGESRVEAQANARDAIRSVEIKCAS